MFIRWTFVLITMVGCGVGRTSMPPLEYWEESPTVAPLPDAGTFSPDVRPGTATETRPSARDTAPFDLLPTRPVDSARRDVLPMVPVDTGIPPLPPPIPPTPPPLPPDNPPIPPPGPPILVDGGIMPMPYACPPEVRRSACERQGLTCLIYTNGTVTGGCVCLNLGRNQRWLCL